MSGGVEIMDGGVEIMVGCEGCEGCEGCRGCGGGNAGSTYDVSGDEFIGGCAISNNGYNGGFAGGAEGRWYDGGAEGIDGLNESFVSISLFIFI